MVLQEEKSGPSPLVARVTLFYVLGGYGTPWDTKGTQENRGAIGVSRGAKGR